jgi:hypothetical protein
VLPLLLHSVIKALDQRLADRLRAGARPEFKPALIGPARQQPASRARRSQPRADFAAQLCEHCCQPGCRRSQRLRGAIA